MICSLLLQKETNFKCMQHVIKRSSHRWLTQDRRPIIRVTEVLQCRVRSSETKAVIVRCRSNFLWATVICQLSVHGIHQRSWPRYVLASTCSDVTTVDIKHALSPYMLRLSCCPWWGNNLLQLVRRCASSSPQQTSDPQLSLARHLNVRTPQYGKYVCRVLEMASKALPRYMTQSIIIIPTDDPANIVGHISGGVTRVVDDFHSNVYFIWYGNQMDLAVQAVVD